VVAREDTLMSAQWKVAIAFAAVAVALLAAAALVVGAESQVWQVFEADGRRVGWGQERDGRLDFYDREGKRLGWGRRDPATGIVETFGPNGERRGTLRPDPGNAWWLRRGGWR